MPHYFRDPEGKILNVLLLQNVQAVGSGTSGTVIATFEDGRYPQRRGGQHVAFYLRASEIQGDRMTEAVVMDQFHTYGGRPRPNIESRKIPKRPQLRHLPNGDPDYSNDLTYFYVVQ